MHSINLKHLKSRISILESQELLSVKGLDFLYDSRMEADFDISSWIKEARTHWGQSQEALGDRLGKTKGNISAWENGRHEPSLKQVLQISAITGYALPMGAGVTIVKDKPANDALRMDPVELADVIRGFMYGNSSERLAILTASRRVINRLGDTTDESSTG